MPTARFIAGFSGLVMGFALMAVVAVAQPAPPPNLQSGMPPAPPPSTDPKLSLQANADFLAQNAKKPGIVSRPSGLQYRIIRNGFGRHPTTQDTVEVYYTGKMINGEVFDGTSPGLPASFNINGSGLIQGWIEVLQLMREGDHWEVFIPARLAYGTRGRNTIPPNQTLIFDMRLLGTKAPPRPGEPGYVPPPGSQPGR